MPRPVHALMTEGGVVALRVMELLERRHLNVIRRRPVEGRAAAVANHYAEGREPGLDGADTIIRIDRRRGFRGIALAEPVDLLDVEDGVGLQEGDLAQLFLAGLVGFRLREGVGVDHGGPGLALADMTAQGERLAEGHPGRGLEAPGHGFGPQQQDVDAAVGLAVVTQGPADAGGRGPWLGPRPDAGLQLGDDPVGDPAVEVRTSGFVGARHGGLLEMEWRRRGGGAVSAPPRFGQRDQIRLCPPSTSTREA